MKLIIKRIKLEEMVMNEKTTCLEWNIYGTI